MGFHGHKWTDQMRSRRNAKLGSPAERILSRIEYDTNGGCWLWTGCILQTGYGSIQIDGVPLGAHRASYMLFRGDIPAGLFVCHRCDVPACVNPDHLFVGTATDNNRDMMAKGRHPTPRGSSHVGARLTEADIPVILALLNDGLGCREIGARYGVTDCAINAIRRGRSWAHITGIKRGAREGVVWSDPQARAEAA